SSSQFVNIDTTMMPITVGFRYYFDVKNAPKVLSIANPYVVLGAGMYIRGQNVLAIQGLSLQSGSTTTTYNWGGYFGAGAEFLLYRKSVYLGLDLRYHLIFFGDSNDTFGGALP